MATLNRNLYRIQELVSAGEIGGLLTSNVPLHSVTFDNTPVAKQSGELNFKGAQIIERTGADGQTSVPGFESISQTESVGVELEDSLEWVVRQVGDGFSRVRVFLRYPNGLFRFSSKGKYQSWDMQYDIQISTDNSVWIPIVATRSSYRTQKSFDRVHVVPNPNINSNAGFYIRCRRARGAGNERETGTLFWHANVLLETSPQTYPDTAYYSIEFDAQQLGNVLPDRGYHLRGLICLVPTTYEPTLYDGTTGEITQHASYSSSVWDGSFKLAHCTDQAWVAYNLLVNETWGAGKTVDADAIDIYSFWEASKYNVELIDDEINPPHPRFVYNGRIASISDMRAHCDEVLATSQASTYEENGIIRCYQDHPKLPRKLFIPANVVDGIIERQSSPLESRLTVCEITFNDRTDRFEPTTEVVEVDQELIDAYGYRITNIAQNGVVDRPQAIRAARWQIENSHTAGNSAYFGVGWENWDTAIGDIVYVLDDVLNESAISGRVLSVNEQVITLDRFLDRDVLNESMLIQTINGLIETSATGLNGQNTVTVGSVIDTERMDVFTIYDGELDQYRVIGYSMAQGVKGLVCGLHDPTKYARIEVGEEYSPEYPPLDPEDILPPSNFGAFGNISDGVPAVYIDWLASADPENPDLPDTRVANYILEWDGPAGRDEITVQDTSYQIEPADLGEYSFTVTAYTTQGTPSPSINTTLTFIPDGSSELLPPTVILGDLSGKDLHLQWTENPNNESHPRFSNVAYIVEFSDEATGASSSVRIPFIDASTVYRHTYNYDDNVADHGQAVRQVYVRIRVEDNLELLSTAVENNFTNTAPMAPRQTLVAGFNTIQVSLQPDATLPDWESDVAGFIVEVNGVEIDISNNTLTSFQGVPDVDYIVRSAAYDLFGKDDLNWSAAESVRVDSIAPPTIPDFSRVVYLFTGLEWEIEPDNGTLSWSEHVASQYTWNEQTEAYDVASKSITTGSLTYVAELSYIGFDFETPAYIRTTFDDWYSDADYLMGEVREVNGRFAWYDDGIDKLAVNAISAKHIQADAITGDKILSRTMIVIGDRDTGPNVLILDGTAVGAQAIIWAGSQDSGAASFAITAVGDAIIRGNAVIGGNAIIEQGVTIRGTLDGADGTFEGTLSSNEEIRVPQSASTTSGTLITPNGLYAENGDFRGTVYAEKLIGDVYRVSRVQQIPGDGAEAPTVASNYLTYSIPIRPYNRWLEVSLNVIGMRSPSSPSSPPIVIYEHKTGLSTSTFARRHQCASYQNNSDLQGHAIEGPESALYPLEIPADTAITLTVTWQKSSLSGLQVSAKRNSFDGTGFATVSTWKTESAGYLNLLTESELQAVTDNQSRTLADLEKGIDVYNDEAYLLERIN